MQSDATNIHPVGLISVVILGVALVLLPRRHAAFPMILLACMIPSAQRLVVMGSDFTLLRIMVLFGWSRLLMRNEFNGHAWNRLDTCVVVWMTSGTIMYTLQQGELSALVNRAGWAFDGLGMYFLFRCLLREWDDFYRMTLGFVIVGIPVAAAFALELVTGRNFFAVFGGVREITWVRGGRLRCQGAFGHPILAGCFWAAVMPYMVGLYYQRQKLSAKSGLLLASFIVVACSSSTPLTSVMFMMLGLGMFWFRAHLSLFRWGVLSLLAILHLFIMEKPIWHLMARANSLGGSTGWHRYKIMDAAVNNFSKWFLLGEKDPMSWGVFEMRDITNQYILEGLRGGLITLVLFISVLVVAFRMVGTAVRRLESRPQEQMFAWCIGVGLFVHAVTFLGVSYFGQIIMLVYLNLAMIGSLYGITEKSQHMYPAPLPNPGMRPGTPTRWKV